MLPFENLFIEGQQFFYSDTDPAAAGAAAGAAAASAACINDEVLGGRFAPP